jgi:hypothetical protein
MTSAFTHGKMALATASAKYDKAIHDNPLSNIPSSTTTPLKTRASVPPSGRTHNARAVIAG